MELNDGLEDDVLELMVSACKEAYEKALENGPVLVADDEDGKRYIFETDKFGNRKIFKEIQPSVQYPNGTKFKIKKDLK